MRALTTSSVAFALLLAACSPPASNQQSEAPPAPTPVVVCNALTPDTTKLVAVQDEVAVAAAASDLRGGRIAPGVYDLSSAVRINSATGWTGTRAVALGVTEGADGVVTLNWAGAGEGRALDTWTATLTETPEPRLTYSCGRMGDVPVAFAAEAAALQLRLQDGAGGQLALTFQRRDTP